MPETDIPSATKPLCQPSKKFTSFTLFFRRLLLKYIKFRFPTTRITLLLAYKSFVATSPLLCRTKTHHQITVILAILFRLLKRPFRPRKPLKVAIRMSEVFERKYRGGTYKSVLRDAKLTSDPPFTSYRFTILLKSLLTFPVKNILTPCYKT